MHIPPFITPPLKLHDRLVDDCTVGEAAMEMEPEAVDREYFLVCIDCITMLLLLPQTGRKMSAATIKPFKQQSAI